MHFYTEPKDAQKLAKMVGDNEISEKIDKRESQHDKQEVFEAIDFLVNAASEIYCEEDKSWDDMCEALSESILKLKGKEKKLKDLAGEGKDEDLYGRNH